uniref:sn-1-specific diacylglycerol lipase n=1 Tax=Albugo laibachii Nc14 TaxID=890382 RepID=F0W1R7_9STRA|nr:conserved hypothetical protein [Albugo laibachii Nc14]|eukprot:CCA14996.1 conserved hypothetical protein [Albugo laibachii Nc14]
MEIIENQRWYTILGWSSRLSANDPPPWSTSERTATTSPDSFPDYEWHIFKSEDYDEDGWLYSTSFTDPFAGMNSSSVVRSRVWLGQHKDSVGYQDQAEKTDMKIFSPIPIPKKGENHDSEKTANTMEADEPMSMTEECPSTAPKPESPAPGFLKSAFSLPGSVLGIAGQSIRQVSMLAFDSAHAVTSAALHSDTQASLKHSVSHNPAPSISSVSSIGFPHLSGTERSLVRCCEKADKKAVSPPEAVVSKSCHACKLLFGIHRFQYQCGYCNASFCRDDLPEMRVLRIYNQTLPSRVCKNCSILLDQKAEFQQNQWRCQRVEDFLQDELIPYTNNQQDTTLDKLWRAAGGALAAAKAAPIGATAKFAVVSADFVRKHGRAGLLGFILRNEFLQSFATLKGLIGEIDGLGFQDAALGTYYFMALNRGDRGANPDAEKQAHADCCHVSDGLLHHLLRYAPLALHAIYEMDVMDIQRLCRLQKFSLIYSHIQDQDVRHPSFALVGSKEQNVAVVLIRGSKSVQDLLTDIQAHPEDFKLDQSEQGPCTGGLVEDDENLKPRGFVDSFAHNGMLNAALWIKERIVPSLRVLHQKGYKLVLAGHSLGAGCAALLAVMLQKEFKDLECFAYAVPACVNLHIANSCVPFVHSIVLRDDFVPRAKASNIIKLVEKLKEFSGCWRDSASEDLEAIKDRVKTLWAPRRRAWAQAQAAQRRGRVTTVSNNHVSDQVPIDTENSDKGRAIEWSLTRNNLIDEFENASVSPSTTAALKDEKKVEDELHNVLQVDPKELYIPGNVIHIYFCRGIYEAVLVDRQCWALSHIPVFQNMLSDHLGRNYLSALRIVRDSRRINPKLPEWVPFGTKTRCMCCDAPFTWNSTSSSEAQQNRDQHNCQRCGALVCDGCSEKRKSIPEFGINDSVRVCDCCFYEL